MEGENIDDDGAENDQSEGSESVNQKKEAAQHLAGADEVDVTTGEEHSQEIARQVLGQFRCGNEMKKRVRTKHDKAQSQEDPDDGGDDVHGGDFGLIESDFNRGMIRMIDTNVVCRDCGSGSE